jgi:NADH-quinone oxidoreductase subunit C/D
MAAQGARGHRAPVVNIGPRTRPCTGTFRVQAVMDGETIQDCEAEIGYMHRNFEKMAEIRTYWQIIPYTDRSTTALVHERARLGAGRGEAASGVPAPPRAEAIRVILSEFSRIMDHFVCIGANIVDLGAITPFFMLFRVREDIYELPRRLPAARALTVSYVRHRRPGRGRARGLRHPLRRRPGQGGPTRNTDQVAQAPHPPTASS